MISMPRVILRRRGSLAHAQELRQLRTIARAMLTFTAAAVTLCQVCDRLRSVETALNLLWLLVATVLCGSCVVAGRRGKLRLSLRMGLICSVLLAMLLFPAISMTDDLQAANSEIELSLRHVFEPLPAPLLPALFGGSALLLTCSLLLLVRQRLAERTILEGRLPARVPRFRPAAIRPPTPMGFMSQAFTFLAFAQ